MGKPPRLTLRRHFKMPTLWQAICFFAALFAFFLLIWVIQILGYWPESWTVNPQLEPV